MYPTWITQASGKRVPVVQAFWFTKYLGHLQLEFDDKGDLISASGAPILLDGSIPQDPDVLELLEKYRPGVLEYESEVGSTKVFLDGSCRRNECNLGNLITDGMLDWYSTTSAKSGLSPDPAIALLMGGGIRASINLNLNNGVITKGDTATVLPFSSKLEVMEVTGKTLREALEHAVRRYTDGEKRGEFLQMSGLKVVYDMSKPPQQRVEYLGVKSHSGCELSECYNFSETQKYKVIAVDFLTNGGDGFEMFKKAHKVKTNALDLDVFIQYLQKASPVNPSVDGRIVIKQET